MAMMDCRGYDQENDIIVGNGDDGDNIHPNNNKLRQQMVIRQLKWQTEDSNEMAPLLIKNSTGNNTSGFYRRSTEIDIGTCHQR